MRIVGTLIVFSDIRASMSRTARPGTSRLSSISATGVERRISTADGASYAIRLSYPNRGNNTFARKSADSWLSSTIRMMSLFIALTRWDRLYDDGCDVPICRILQRFAELIEAFRMALGWSVRT